MDSNGIIFFFNSWVEVSTKVCTVAVPVIVIDDPEIEVAVTDDGAIFCDASNDTTCAELDTVPTGSPDGITNDAVNAYDADVFVNELN